MCGIAGEIGIGAGRTGVVEQMTNSIKLRGPDGHGHFREDKIALGHRRLAIVDLSEHGIQPMAYRERYVISYNGEIYNYKELRIELEKLDYEFGSETDTEVIMAAYDAWGTDCINKFNGMWAFVLFDRQEQNCLISRDRFGIKPLLYTFVDGMFVFGSEVKALASHPDINLKPNFSFLESYLNSGPNQYSDYCAFEGIQRFPMAHYAFVSLDEADKPLVPIPYWSASPNVRTEKFNAAKAKELASTYYNLLSDAVRIRMRADVKIGTALSGGLDSSAIVYLVNQELRRKNNENLQETFSCVYSTPGTEHCDESQFINELSVFLGVNSNQVEPVESDVPAEHRLMMNAVEDPPGSCLMSSWHTFKKVAETDVKVTLDGQGADEQLGGYRRYIKTYLTSLTLADFYREVLHFRHIPGVGKTLIGAFLLAHSRRLLGDSLTRLLVQRFRGWTLHLNLNQELNDDFNKGLVNLIHYSDRVSMAHSIESRMPFMDYRLVEFLENVPACYKIRNGWTKYIHRLAFEGCLPDNIVWRKDKVGWGIPEEHWFNGGLKTWIDDEAALGKDHITASGFKTKVNGTFTSLTMRVRLLNISALYRQCFQNNTKCS